MRGRTIGSYVIEGELGIGGMGAVYRARHVVLGRPAAVKVLLPQYSADATIVQRFFNEARAATSIRHLGIVEVYDFAMADGVAYIAMELLHGESLAARIRRGVDPVTSLRLVRQVCGALGAAHERGIVHRDLKPDNVFIVPDPEVVGGERIKLLDFGIAKLAPDGVMASQQTRTGAVMGTPTYMAPEQCRGVKVDARADIYSLGCMLYEMLCGRPPFSGEGVGDILGAHMFMPPTPLASFAPWISPDLSGLVDWTLAKRPDDRPQTTAELTAHIDRLPGGSLQFVTPGPLVIGAPAITTLSSAATVADRRPKRRRVALAAGAVVIAAAAIATWVGRSASPTSVAVAVPADAAVVAVSAEAATVLPVVDASVAPDPPEQIRVRIDASPAGSRVLLAGELLGETPLDRTLRRSDATLVFDVRHDGYQDAQIRAPGSADVDRTVELQPSARPARPAVRRRPAPGPGSAPPTPLGEDDGVNPFH